jgi:hypothetical protein
MNIKFGIAAFGLLSINAHACNTSENLPGENIDLYFERNSAQVSTDQVPGLANWAIDMRSRYPIQEVLSVGGLAEASEKEPQKLARRRADTAKAMLIQFGFTQVPYDLRAGVYTPLEHLIEPPEKIRRAEIELSPGCPNNCCDGK